MDFFRRYQKPILYFAVLFALVVFSITGQVMSFFADLFRGEIPTPHVVVNGVDTPVTEQDLRVGRAIARRRESFDPVMVMPQIEPYERGARVEEFYAALRRYAIELGIGASYDEVDEAIQAVVETRDIDARQLAAAFQSYGAYRTALFETMRIATLIRLELVGARSFDHTAVEAFLKDREVVTLQVASIDGDELEEQLREEHTALEDGDAKVKAWLDELEETDPARAQFNADDRYALEFAGIDLAAFDAAAFETELEGFEPTEEELKQFYNVNKATFYRTEKADDESGEKDENGEKDEENEEGNDENGEPDENGESAENGGEQDPQDPEKPKPVLFAPFTEAKDDVLRRKQAEKVLQAVWKQVQRARFDSLQELIDAQAAAFEARNTAEAHLEVVQAELDEAPDDEAATAAVEAAKEATIAASDVLEEAKKAVQKASEEFDIIGTFRGLTAGKPAFFTLSTGDEPVAASELVDFDGLGTWTTSWRVRAMQKAGQVSSSVEFSKDKVFHFRVEATELRPLKDFEEIKEEATDAYLKQLADDRVAEAKEAFEEALERLAREARSEQVAEIEGKKESMLEERMTEWRDGLGEEIAKLEEQLATTSSTRAKRLIEQQLTEKRETLSKEGKQREKLEEALDEEIAAEVDEELANAYPEVLEAAATEAGMSVSTVGPHLRNPPRYGPIEHLPKAVQTFFYGNRLEDLEVRDATEVVEDFTNRVVQFAVVDAVEPATIDTMSRRDYIQAVFAGRRRALSDAPRQSYSEEALMARIGFTRPGDAAISE